MKFNESEKRIMIKVILENTIINAEIVGGFLAKIQNFSFIMLRDIQADARLNVGYAIKRE